MSSALQSAPTVLQQYDYVSFAILTAVGYDYILVFSKEIEYIWTKSWSLVSSLFIIARYSGLYIIIYCLGKSKFLPNPEKRYVFLLFPLLRLLNPINSCVIVSVLGSWMYILFLGAADLTMILRVWAMYNQSRLILGTLLTLFFLEFICCIVGAAFYSNPRNLLAATMQTPDSSPCVSKSISHIWFRITWATILPITGLSGAAMCILVIVQFVRQSIQMYRVTKQWQLNQYMNLLVKQGVLYFLIAFLCTVINVLQASGMTPTGGWQGDLLFVLESLPVYSLTPRFILSIREMYARDVQGRRGAGIDTGFGLSSDHGASGTAIVFAGVEQDEGLEGIDELLVEVGTTQPE